MVRLGSQQHERRLRRLLRLRLRHGAGEMPQQATWQWPRARRQVAEEKDGRTRTAEWAYARLEDRLHVGRKEMARMVTMRKRKEE